MNVSMTHIARPPPTLRRCSERFERGDLMSAACPSREVLKHITSRWGVLVLIALEGRTRRFSELRRTIGGVSERMLAQTLQWLERMVWSRDAPTRLCRRMWSTA